MYATADLGQWIVPRQNALFGNPGRSLLYGKPASGACVQLPAGLISKRPLGKPCPWPPLHPCSRLEY
jgi:hypothetical protein